MARGRREPFAGETALAFDPSVQSHVQEGQHPYNQALRLDRKLAYVCVTGQILFQVKFHLT